MQNTKSNIYMKFLRKAKPQRKQNLNFKKDKIKPPAKINSIKKCQNFGPPPQKKGTFCFEKIGFNIYLFLKQKKYFALIFVRFF